MGGEEGFRCCAFMYIGCFQCKKGVKMKKIVLILSALLFTAMTAVSASAESSGLAGSPSYKIEKNGGSQKTGDCIVTIRTNVSGASVYIDSSYKGTTPMSLKVSEGSHKLEVKKTHYATRDFYFNISYGQEKDFYVDLERITGYIDIDCPYSDAVISIGSSSAHKGSNEVDEGNYNVTVKKFGYTTYSASVYVQRNRTTNLKVSLTPARFDCLEIEPSRKSFNPKNRARHGEIDIDFYVTAEEDGVLEILDSAGNVCASREYHFTTWNYSFTWDGSDSEGWICYDGHYTARLTAGGKSWTCGFDIDSSITYPLTVLNANGTGIGNVPLPLAFPDETLIISLGAGADVKVSSSGESSFYAVPFDAGLCWVINEHFELSGGFHSLIQEDSLLACTGALKMMSKSELSSDSSLNYGLVFRIGASDKRSFAPYGADTINGASAGAMLGLLNGDTYIGFNGQFTYNPVEGLQEKGTARTSKASVSLLKSIDNFGIGLYGSVENCWGKYSYTDELNGVEREFEREFDGSICAYDAGLQFTAYVGDGNGQLSFNAGVLIYPKKENYVYAKLIYSYVF